MPDTHVAPPRVQPARAVRLAEEPWSSPSYQAFRILHLGFIVAPFLAGLDKFFGVLTNWDQYLAPSLARLSPLTAHGTMVAVGIVEIAAAVVVALRPRVGALIVAAWLAGIIVNLCLLGAYWDIALRDLGLCLGAIALWRLSVVEERRSAASLD